MRWSIALLAGAGCTGHLDDRRFQTGSATVTTSTDRQALFVVDEVGDGIGRLDTDRRGIAWRSVGSRPTRIARAGDHLYVTLRGERQVAVVTADRRMRVVDRIDVGVEPFGVVGSEDGARVYVAVSLAGEVVEIDTEDRTIARSWHLEGEPRWLALDPDDRGLWVASPSGVGLWRIDLVHDDVWARGLVESPLFHPRRSAIVDRITGDPAVSPDGAWLGVPVFRVDRSGLTNGRAAYYERASGPELHLIPLENRGEPADAATVVPVPGHGYPTSVTFDPRSEWAHVTFETGSAVLAVPVPDPYADDAPSPLTLHTAAGPRGVVFTTRDESWVHTFLDGGLAALPRAADVAQRPYPIGHADRLRPVGDPDTSPEHAGRRLFYASDDDRISSGGGLISCSSCHFDGRADGLTWPLEHGLRQTPSLAGGIAATAPFTWTQDVDSIAEEAMLTSETRMGGQLQAGDARDLAAFVAQLPAPDARTDGLAAVARGAAIFARPEVGCAGCHSGEMYTDNRRYDLFGLEGVVTRHLVGIAASAPYLHDGSAPTLRDLLVRLRDGSMGSTASLSDAELDDLEAFLRSL